ncbi:hypothetical protein BH160DRAFT_2811 [Burkholderia sp. H160]|nr:hypothetical protein BH160DRAFT_2811 [Burkholderia sp. H160]
MRPCAFGSTANARVWLETRPDCTPISSTITPTINRVSELAAPDRSRYASVTMPILRAWTFGSGKSMLSVPVRARLAVNTADAAIAAAILDVGLIRVLSYQVADALRANELRVVLEAFESTPLPVNLVHAGQTPLPLKLRAFLDLATPRLHARISGEGSA